MSPFTEEAKKLLFEGKYCQWAKDIDVETLHVLFWFIGELSCRSDVREFINFGNANDFRDVRRDIAMETIMRIHGRERFSGAPIEAPRAVFREAMERRLSGQDDNSV